MDHLKIRHIVLLFLILFRLCQIVPPVSVGVLRICVKYRNGKIYLQCLKSECDETIHLGNYRAGPTNDQMPIIKYGSILQPWLLITGVLWTRKRLDLRFFRL